MKTRNHMTGTDGALVNTDTWQEIRPARAYSFHHRKISTGRDLRACLRAGDYAWPGGYALFYIADDGGTFCPDCVRKNLRNITDSIRTRTNDGWRIIGLECTENVDIDEENPLVCCNCNAEIQ